MENSMALNNERASKNTYALYDYLMENSSCITEAWLNTRVLKEGSHYSVDVSPEVFERIKSQNTTYVELIAKSLLQTEESMRKSVENWTKNTAYERADSETSISEITNTCGTFRRLYWEQIRLFLENTSLSITINDVLRWEKNINQTLDFILESFSVVYMEVVLERLSSQQAVIRELSAPIIPLSDEMGVLPIIGDIDTHRAQWILETTLMQSIELKISVLIIDLSGVAIMDTMVAHQLIKVIDSLHLIGVKTVLTGIRSDVAQTVTDLGVNFQRILTFGTLKQAIKFLQK